MSLSIYIVAACAGLIAPWVFFAYSIKRRSLLGVDIDELPELIACGEFSAEAFQRKRWTFNVLACLRVGLVCASTIWVVTGSWEFYASTSGDFQAYTVLWGGVVSLLVVMVVTPLFLADGFRFVFVNLHEAAAVRSELDRAGS